MWLVHEAANRPWPVLDEDPVIDFQIMEAVNARVVKLKNDAQKTAEKKKWKESVKEDNELMQFAG